MVNKKQNDETKLDRIEKSIKLYQKALSSKKHPSTKLINKIKVAADDAKNKLKSISERNPELKGKALKVNEHNQKLVKDTKQAIKDKAGRRKRRSERMEITPPGMRPIAGNRR